ncbi:MAG: response regulator [Bradyrhizobiaceae bacterium]|nr:response regulator [Aerococcus mictus]RTL74900.1 MAG: response regulator [Bradyrhizobiaceae bacterium]
MNDEILILVVEDEMLLQALLEETLKDGGYDVTVVSTGEEAIKLLDADEPKYRALVTDVNLGRKVDGWDVARRAREINADTGIVYITGHGAADWASRGVPNSIVLTKPFAPAQLITAVSQLINTGQTPT